MLGGTKFKLLTTTGVVKSVDVWDGALISNSNGRLLWTPFDSQGKPTMLSRQFLKYVELFGAVEPTSVEVNPFLAGDEYDTQPWQLSFFGAELVTDWLYAYSIDGVDQLDGLEFYELFNKLRTILTSHDGRALPDVKVYEYGRKESYANATTTTIERLGNINVRNDSGDLLLYPLYVETDDDNFAPLSECFLPDWLNDGRNAGRRAIIRNGRHTGQYIAPACWDCVPFCCVNDGGKAKRITLPDGWHY